jgi:predicted alpha/beta hydrolase family esterase
LKEPAKVPLTANIPDAGWLLLPEKNVLFERGNLEFKYTIKLVVFWEKRRRRMIRTLLVPGLDGSPAPHWQHWWAATDPAARIVKQQSWSIPEPDAWLEALTAAILAHPNALLVGHSLGAVAIVHLLAKRPKLHIGGAMLVAPAEPSRSVRTESFGPIPECSLNIPALVVSSRNDFWMGQEQARELAQAWGADFIDMGDAGHINTESGFGPWHRGKFFADRIAGVQDTLPFPANYRKLERALAINTVRP